MDNNATKVETVATKYSLTCFNALSRAYVWLCDTDTPLRVAYFLLITIIDKWHKQLRCNDFGALCRYFSHRNFNRSNSAVKVQIQET